MLINNKDTMEGRSGEVDTSAENQKGVYNKEIRLYECNTYTAYWEQYV